MSRLRIERVADDAFAADWRHVHNTIIPTHLLSPEDVRDRGRRNLLDVAYLGDTLVGNTTVRPPTEEEPAATVIARVLTAHRGRGFGRELYAYALGRARELRPERIETVVLESNEAGLRFALKQGFAEFERYVLPGDTIAYVTLRLP
ncbi:GNAT family N-acetyltransferase [Actinacidiphila alni]|uniref:GNAT family N-acetyltransferase n=1 Tax=Actinacidiphila alni TaxID=380248 RepID=UPI000B8408F8|nr:GNAT family N-acetyltransferase [Actinacidiphila alni]